MEDVFDHFDSTDEGPSGILVDVHSVGFCENWGFGDFQFLKSNPNEPEQPIETSHLDLRDPDTSSVVPQTTNGHGVFDATGWVSLADDTGASGFPVWPHPDYVQACATETWAGSLPAEIDVHEFVNSGCPI